MTRVEAPRVLVLGDSWLRGIGTGEGTIARLVPAALGATDVLDLSMISRTSSDVVGRHLHEVRAYRPDVAVVGLGPADSLVFPAPFIQRFIDKHAPPKWQGIDGLMPKAYYSRHRGRRVRAKAEVTVKTAVKHAAVTAFGAHRRVGVAHMRSNVETVLDLLDELGTLSIVLGVTPVDSVSQPRTGASFRHCDATLRQVAAGRPSALFVDTADAVECWDDYLSDKLHLARSGHRKITDRVLDRLRSAGELWAPLVTPIRPHRSPHPEPKATT